MKQEKGLQKFTDSEDKVQKVFALEQITPKDLKQLNSIEMDRLIEIIRDKHAKLKGLELDELNHKIEPIVSQTTKNEVWEYNHNQITWAISTLMQEFGRMPTKTEIATKTELSRQTIHKHLKEYANHPQYLGQIEQFRFITSKVLAKVFHFAVNGDMRAANLYFNVIGLVNNGQSQNNTLIQNQNNYIQINGTVLSQETLKHLKPEQLNTIENILKSFLPQIEEQTS